MTKVAARTWSATTRSDRCVTSRADSRTNAISGAKRSVSKLLGTSWRIEVTRSRPIPVSIAPRPSIGRGSSRPSGCLSNWGRTRFQNSRNRSQWSGPQFGRPHPCSGPRSHHSSVSGPQGPSSRPHQFSAFSAIQAEGTPTDRQMSMDSSSSGWTVTRRRSPGSPRPTSAFVANSQASGIAVSLK